MALEQELATFKRELPNLVDKIGKFVLIRGDERRRQALSIAGKPVPSPVRIRALVDSGALSF
jgi:hypothetical protein